jgi:hypothetical protein
VLLPREQSFVGVGRVEREGRGGEFGIEVEVDGAVAREGQLEGSE